MNNKECLELATKVGATNIVKFEQIGKNCIGYVSTWLRKRAKDKMEAWDKNYLFFTKGNKSEPNEKKFNKLIKVADRQKAFAKDSQEEREYITHGGTKDSKEVLKFVKRTDPQSCAVMATSGIKSLFVNAHKASIAVFTAKAAHAIGIDCNKDGTCCYFDPDLGEITFKDCSDFELWWKSCYQSRHEPIGGELSVFGFFTGQYQMDIYMKV